MERALVALCALVANSALGGPRRLLLATGMTALANLPGQWLRDLERRLDREHRSLSERRVRGAVLAGFVLIPGLIIGIVIDHLLGKQGFLIEMLLLTMLLPVRPSWDLARDIQKSLSAGQLPAARATLAYTNWRHHALMDEHSVARAAIENLVVNFALKMVGGLFWYMWLGLPGLFASRLITLMRETFIYSPRGISEFAKPIITLDEWVHYFPSRIAALFWLLVCGFLSPARVPFAIQKIRSHLADPLLDFVLLAPALTLNLSLGGPSSIYTQSWQGMGTVKAQALDIKRALYLFVLLHLLLFLAIGFFL